MKERDQLRFVWFMIKSGRHMGCIEMGVAVETFHIQRVILLLVVVGIIFDIMSNLCTYFYLCIAPYETNIIVTVRTYYKCIRLYGIVVEPLYEEVRKMN